MEPRSIWMNYTNHISNRLYWYSYALNNPLRFIDPSGYYDKPSPHERDQINGFGIYSNWFLGNGRRPFASMMANSLTGGWHCNGIKRNGIITWYRSIG